DTQPGEYHVRKGDSLARIATQVKASGVSLDQMLVALYQANPDAFVGNNMNRLKAGQILSVPSAETAKAVNTAEARGMIVAQAADFNNYRNKLAGQVATAAAQKSAESRQSAGGKITAKVEEQPTPASESKDKLKLSNALPAPGKNAGKLAGGTPAVEDKIAQDKAVADANARVKELEKNVNDLQKVLEVKNQSLAEQQKQANVAKTEAKPETPSPQSPVAASPTSTPAPATAAASAAEAKPEVKPEVKPEAPALPPVASAPPVAKPKPTAPPPQPDPSFVDELLDNPLVLPGVGALLVAVGALGIYRARRQKQSKQFEDSIITDSSLKANSLFGSTGGQSVDTNNSVFNSSFSPSVSQLDSNEVDPVAEADVYIAYGRDAQAEEILKEALRTQPERHAVRVKLLEIYSNRKDLRAFEVLATELYGLTKGGGDEWAQAAALGIAIDPNNPLYASGKSGSDGVAPSGVLVAPTQPLDEQGLATLLSTTQADTSSLDIVNELETDSAYFGNTDIATAQSVVEPDTAPEQEPVASKASSNELDFDLEGMSFQDMAVPNTIPRPAPVEPSAELASIDFDFLDEPKVKSAEIEPALAPEAGPEITLEVPDVPSIADLKISAKDESATEETQTHDIPLAMRSTSADVAPLEIDIPGLDVPAPAEAKSEAAADPLDFDLSGISLELNPEETEAKPDLAFEKPDLKFELNDESMSSNSAEMATKLDLAIAYQEIGDKEGARELLDEVLKGGTLEQSEKAKSLLLELA
ncbi:MAG: FimV/HubP family polar landmark protein, partial [Noviherbaspirillum sp.]